MPRTQARVGRRRTGPAAAALAAALLAAAFSCSLDYESARIEDRVPASLPDTVATGLVHRVVKNSRTALEVTAARAESWDAQHRTVLADATFVEYDREGNPSVEGSAGTVVYHSDTEDAEASGRVRVRSNVDEAGIECEAFSWQNGSRILSAPPRDRVVITKDDGSRIEGTGFVGDFRKREIVFNGPVQGSYVWNREEESE